MLALKIENVKDFMSRLFAGDMFDKFQVRECEVTTFTTFSTRGQLNKEWFDSDEKETLGSEELVTWLQLKTIIYSLIKGNKTPSKMKIDFCHYRENGDCGSLRLQFENQELFLFTGYMQKEFSLEKEKQINWDESCIQFLKRNEIVSTHIE